MPLPREPLRLGYDVDENAIRFSNYFHVLRELVHLSAGWLPLVPQFELKYRLGDHLHDDARAVAKVRRRLYELRHPSDYPGAPGEALAALLDRMRAAGSPDEYLGIAYGEAKPALVAAMRTHLEALDPVSDEPSLRLLTKLARRQEGHVEELTAPGSLAASPEPSGDLGALSIELKAESRRLRVMAPLDEPARDDFVEVTPEGDPYLARELYVNDPDVNHVPVEREEQRHFFHALMDAELCAAELMARNSHEHPEMPWDFHVDMARQTWDEVRHARLHHLLMPTELGCQWGDYPVGLSYFRSVYAHDLLGRLALFNSTSEQKAMWRHSRRRKVLVDRGQEQIAQVFDYLLADEVPHVHNGTRWGAYLCDGDEAAYRAAVRELREGLDETGAPAAAPGLAS
ncbi:MAG: hypothetical protein AUG48_06395 [Actinobacteria bacterium 13_1_20CM_3_68_9]|nr:MAG: hypothetical protein AUG48_06395 [Actinobacteria bacterium 13_1_20CM_3_68_9]